MDVGPVVFIVDDDPAIRKSLRWLIESIGVKVQVYESAQAFLDSYDADVPGCIVLDVRMPGMSGLELQERLNGRGIDLPMIMVTAYGDIPTAVRAMKAGAVDFLEKPVVDQDLLDLIQRAIVRDVEHRR
jgi:FixJ family two-component response regulator